MTAGTTLPPNAHRRTQADALAWMTKRAFESDDAPALSPDRHDHALMVAMASRDSDDTRPEAGPAAGDRNPSYTRPPAWDT